MNARALPTGRRSLALAALFVAAGIAVLLGLGVWQVERLNWKNGLIAQIEQRSRAAPKPLPPSSEWARLAVGDHEYERFTVAGAFEHQHEALIYRSTGKLAGAMSQPGYWVMTPLRMSDGARVLVNRGFIALDRKDVSTRATGQTTGEITLAGMLRAPETRGFFTPPDTPAKGEWFTRDPLAIAAALKLERMAPFSIDQDAYAAPPGAPAGGATVIDIPNNHLSYALTWFALAATLAALFGVIVWRQREASLEHGFPNPP